MISYDTNSFVAHKDEIKNPSVEYMILKEDGLNDHNPFFFTTTQYLIKDHSTKDK